MKDLRLGSSLTFAATVSLLAVFGTFVFALLSNESKRIPGVVDVTVSTAADSASVGIAWGAGLAVLFAVAALAATLISAYSGSDRS